MDIKTQVYQRVTAVSVTGRVDSASASDLEAALKQQVEEGKVHFVLDLSGVEFLSSSGLRVLVTTLKAVRKSGGDLRLAQPSQRALRRHRPGRARCALPDLSRPRSGDRLLLSATARRSAPRQAGRPHVA